MLSVQVYSRRYIYVSSDGVKELNDKKEGNIVDSMYYKVIFVSFSRSIAKRTINDGVFFVLGPSY